MGMVSSTVAAAFTTVRRRSVPQATAGFNACTPQSHGGARVFGFFGPRDPAIDLHQGRGRIVK
jgi:hypothetical protein